MSASGRLQLYVALKYGLNERPLSDEKQQNNPNMSHNQVPGVGRFSMQILGQFSVQIDRTVAFRECRRYFMR